MKPLANNKTSPYHNKLATGTISKDVKDYSNDPTIIKRAQEAKEFLEKVGLPNELLKIRDADWGKNNRNYNPAAISKTEEAIKFLEKAGLPEELLKIRDAQWGKK